MTEQAVAVSRERMTLSEMVRRLMERGGHERSSVSLTRNAKGETQIDVTVRTSETPDGAIPDIDAAEAAAGIVYDRLRARYPMSDGYTVATTAPRVSSTTTTPNEEQQT